MSVSLTSNFFRNARGLTLLDGGGITWSINANTNAISGSVSGAPGSGLNVTITTAKLTGGGTEGSMTFTDGVLTAQTPAT